jgi:hypothetical protein
MKRCAVERRSSSHGAVSETSASLPSREFAEEFGAPMGAPVRGAHPSMAAGHKHRVFCAGARPDRDAWTPIHTYTRRTLPKCARQTGQGRPPRSDSPAQRPQSVWPQGTSAVSFAPSRHTGHCTAGKPAPWYAKVFFVCSKSEKLVEEDGEERWWSPCGYVPWLAYKVQPEHGIGALPAACLTDANLRFYGTQLKNALRRAEMLRSDQVGQAQAAMRGANGHSMYAGIYAPALFPALMVGNGIGRNPARQMWSHGRGGSRGGRGGGRGGSPRGGRGGKRGSVCVLVACPVCLFTVCVGGWRPGCPPVRQG